MGWGRVGGAEGAYAHTIQCCTQTQTCMLAHTHAHAAAAWAMTYQAPEACVKHDPAGLVAAGTQGPHDAEQHERGDHLGQAGLLLRRQVVHTLGHIRGGRGWGSSLIHIPMGTEGGKRGVWGPALYMPACVQGVGTAGSFLRDAPVIHPTCTTPPPSSPLHASPPTHTLLPSPPFLSLHLHLPHVHPPLHPSPPPPLAAIPTSVRRYGRVSESMTLKQLHTRLLLTVATVSFRCLRTMRSSSGTRPLKMASS